LINYKYFFNRHPQFDVGVQSLCWIGKDWFEVNDLVIEYNAMANQYPQQTLHLVQAFQFLFEDIFTLLIHDQPVEKLMLHSEQMKDEHWKNAFFAELNNLKSSGEYPNLLATLEWLISK
jgi:hypothetical protein